MNRMTPVEIFNYGDFNERSFNHISQNSFSNQFTQSAPRNAWAAKTVASSATGSTFKAVIISVTTVLAVVAVGGAAFGTYYALKNS